MNSINGVTEGALNVVNRLLDMVYPSSIYCLCCGKVIDKSRSYSLCDKCVRDIEWAGSRVCKRCGRVLSISWSNALCANCMENLQDFDRGYVCCQYGAHARAIIFSYKYGDKPYIGHHIAQAMADRLKLAGAGEISGHAGTSMKEYRAAWDLITFVPTEGKKARERGFDHAELLAEIVAKEIDVPFEKALIRSKKTIPQRGLSPSERRDNVKGAFELVKNVKDQRIILVDDIFTTGATINECVSVLKTAGAQQVDFICFAAGANRY